MFYIFLAVYSAGVDVAGVRSPSAPLPVSGSDSAIQVVFYSELFPNHIRAKGVCLSMATVALTDLV